LRTALLQSQSRRHARMARSRGPAVVKHGAHWSRQPILEEQRRDTSTRLESVTKVPVRPTLTPSKNVSARRTSEVGHLHDRRGHRTGIVVRTGLHSLLRSTKSFCAFDVIMYHRKWTVFFVADCTVVELWPRTDIVWGNVYSSIYVD